MGVEYLLDRDIYRPAINIENGHAQTALIRACLLNRKFIVKALLIRGADVRKQNRLGRQNIHVVRRFGC